MIQPVREVGMRDLAMMCHFQKLPIIAPQHKSTFSKPSINSLAEDFVARLQATVPSSVSTIIRTAGKLQVTKHSLHVRKQHGGDYMSANKTRVAGVLRAMLSAYTDWNVACTLRDSLWQIASV